MVAAAAGVAVVVAVGVAVGVAVVVAVGVAVVVAVGVGVGVVVAVVVAVGVAVVVAVGVGVGVVVAVVVRRPGIDGMRQAAAFIAHARADVPALLAALERAEALAERWAALGRSQAGTPANRRVHARAAAELRAALGGGNLRDALMAPDEDQTSTPAPCTPSANS